MPGSNLISEALTPASRHRDCRAAAATTGRGTSLTRTLNPKLEVTLASQGYRRSESESTAQGLRPRRRHRSRATARAFMFKFARGPGPGPGSWHAGPGPLGPLTRQEV